MIRTLVAEPVTGPVAGHGEGPVWHPSFAGVRWVDMLAGEVLELTAGGVGRTRIGDVAAAFRPRAGGGTVAADERGFLLLDGDLRVERRIGPLWEAPDVRMNEGGCDPVGAFWCGSMAYDARPGAGTLYRLDPDLSVQPVLTGVTVSNGFGFSPDGRRAYYVDTPTGRVDVFHFDADAGPAALRRRRPAVVVPAMAGMPDGLAVDAEGALWVALWGGSAVHRYRPDGRLDTVVELPVSQVTACTFGGADLSTLYVTTSTEGLDDLRRPRQPLAGALFALSPGTTGTPVREFAG